MEIARLIPPFPGLLFLLGHARAKKNPDR